MRIESQYDRWAIACIVHPSSGRSFIIEDSVRRTRKECIASFSAGSSIVWRTQKKRYNVRCVKIKVTLKTIEE